MCYNRLLAIPKHDSEHEYEAITENVGQALFFIRSFVKVAGFLIAFVAQKQVHINESRSLAFMLEEIEAYLTLIDI